MNVNCHVINKIDTWQFVWQFANLCRFWPKKRLFSPDESDVKLAALRDVKALGLHLCGGSRAVCTRDTHENDDLQAGGSARNVFIVFSAMMAELGNQAMGRLQACARACSLAKGEKNRTRGRRPQTSKRCFICFCL